LLNDQTFHGTTFSLFPILKSELETVALFVKEIEGDAYAGVKNVGISQEIKNLLYFCVRALKILGGEDSLRSYGEFGGDNSQLTVPMKVTIDAMIEKLKERQVKIVSEVGLDEVDFLTNDKTKEDIDGVIRFLRFRSKIDDGNGGPSGPPGHTQLEQTPGPSTDVIDHSDSGDDQDERMSSVSSASSKRPQEVGKETP
jgi:hypothetical protein